MAGVGATAESRLAFVVQLLKLPIATEARWGYDATASPPPKQAFQTLIGEPGHTKPHAARPTAEATATVVCLGVRFSVHGQKGCQRFVNNVI
jgi:hypothetical protein